MIRRYKKDISETLVHEAISGLNYPASKEELLRYALDHGVQPLTRSLLEKLPEMEYQNEPQVLSTLKEYADA